MGAIWSKAASAPAEGRSCQCAPDQQPSRQSDTDEELHVSREIANQSPEEDRSAIPSTNAGTSEVVSAALDRSVCLELDETEDRGAKRVVLGAF